MQDYGPIMLTSGGAIGQNAVDESTASLFREDIIEALSALATAGSSEPVGYATFESTK